MIRDILTDIVAHTSSLNFPFAKISSNKTETVIESVFENLTVKLTAKTHNPIHEFQGTFGLPNLNTLNLLLKNPEYKENPKIEIIVSTRNGKDKPTSIFFENEHKDFNNDYQLMSAEVVQSKMDEYVLEEPNYNVVFTPSVNSVQRLKLQAQIHSEENIFKTKIEKNNLIVSFGGIQSTHVGSFVFQSDIEGKMRNIFNWPLQDVSSILTLDGDKLISISDEGLMKISVDSGLANYEYFIPAVTK
ncbi:MAG: hypothetical protein EBT86_09285 [Actinobacteria bacterium]|nr:hypothetical protein [Actinomycetota bacterium]